MKPIGIGAGGCNYWFSWPLCRTWCRDWVI